MSRREGDLPLDTPDKDLRAPASDAPASGASAGSVASPSVEKPPQRIPETIAPPRWEKMASDDLGLLVQRLGAAGFPEDVVFNIGRSLVSERFAARRADILSASIRERRNIDRTEMAELRAVRIEEQWMLANVTGFADVASERVEKLQQRFGDLSIPKLLLIESIFADYGALSTQVYNPVRAHLSNSVQQALPWEREILRMIDDERRADLEETLTPEERINYDLSGSMIAMAQREGRLAIEVTASEWRAVAAVEVEFRLQTDISDRQQGAASLQMLNDARVQRDREIAEIVGPERAATYQRSFSADSILANNIARRLGLPIENGNRVAEMGQTVRRKLAALKSGTTPEQQHVQLSETLAEADALLEAQLGRRGADGFRSAMSGWYPDLRRAAGRDGTSRGGTKP